MIEQCIFFGDSSVVLRSDIPKTPEIALEAATADHGLKLTITVEGKPVNSARVVVATDLHGFMVGITDEAGVVELSFADGTITGAESVAVTVTGANLIPIIQQQVDLPQE